MKKITAFTVVLAGLLIVNSCDSLTTSFDTNLSTTILVDVEQPQEGKSGLKDAHTYPFSATKTLSIKDNSQINDYIDRLREINVNIVTATFTGIPSGETITELAITIESVDLNVTLEDLVNGVSVTLDISPQLLDDLSEELLDAQQITIGVSGYSTFAPMILSTLMDFEVTVTANVLD